MKKPKRVRAGSKRLVSSKRTSNAAYATLIVGIFLIPLVLYLVWASPIGGLEALGRIVLVFALGSAVVVASLVLQSKQSEKKPKSRTLSSTKRIAKASYGVLIVGVGLIVCVAISVWNSPMGGLALFAQVVMLAPVLVIAAVTALIAETLSLRRVNKVKMLATPVNTASLSGTLRLLGISFAVLILILIGIIFLPR